MLVLVTYLVEADRFDKGLLCLYLVIIGYQNSLAYTYNQKKVERYTFVYIVRLF